MRFRWSVRRTFELCISIGFSLSSAAVVFGQGRDTSATPVPLVSAGISVPAQNVDWSHYTAVEDCVGAFQRALSSTLVLLQRDTLRDTTRDTTQMHIHTNLWTPLPPAAIHVGQMCLSHFLVATLPVPALPSTLRLAVGVNADSLIPAIIARQLAQATTGPARVTVLRTAIEVLMQNRWEGVQDDGRLTAAHVQLANEQLAHLDALGAVALRARVELREGNGPLQLPARAAHDVDAQLVILREIDKVFQKVPLDSLSRDSVALRRWYVIHEAANALYVAGLTYVQSMSHADLAKYVTTSAAMGNAIGIGNIGTLLGIQAPPVSGAYWFNTPHGDGVPMPVPGKINILWFQSGEVGNRTYDWQKIPRALRQLHQEFPEMQLTVVTHTNGAMHQQAFVDHPEQEAALLGRYWTDSVQVPGIVCVLKSEYKTVEGGHVVPLPLPVWEAYHLRFDGGVLLVIDPTGIIVGAGDKPYQQDLEEFVRRLHAKGPPTTAMR